MSSASGITASDSLVARVHAFTASPARALLLTIDTAALNISATATIAATSSLSADLDNIVTTYLNDTDCAYILLKYTDTEPANHAFISYVPDNAAVRSKMLYASTKNTFLRTLNSGQHDISPVLFINSPDELSATGWAKIMHSIASDAPLTESEIMLEKVKNDEIVYTSSTTARPNRLAADSNTNLLFAIQPELDNVLLNSVLANQLITCTIDVQSETLQLSNSANDITESQLVSQLTQHSSSTPAYHLYKNSANQSFFILTCPSGSKVRERMLYATNKQGLINHLKQNNWCFTKIIEIGDPDELEISEIFSSIQTTSDSNDSTSNPSSNSLRFAKPKGPRRR